MVNFQLYFLILFIPAVIYADLLPGWGDKRELDTIEDYLKAFPGGKILHCQNAYVSLNLKEINGKKIYLPFNNKISGVFQVFNEGDYITAKFVHKGRVGGQTAYPEFFDLNQKVIIWGRGHSDQFHSLYMIREKNWKLTFVQKGPKIPQKFLKNTLFEFQANLDSNGGTVLIRRPLDHSKDFRGNDYYATRLEVDKCTILDRTGEWNWTK